MLFELLEVAVLNLLHESFAPEEVCAQIGSKLARHNEELIVERLRKGDRAARGNKMRTPLEHEADVPEDEDREDGRSGGKRDSAGAEILRGAVEENTEAENEERRQRNEKAVAVRRNSRPVRVTSNEKVKGNERGEECSAGARLAPPEKDESNDGEKKNGRPDKQPVIRGEEHIEEGWREPQPIFDGDVAGFKSVAEDDIARDESGQQANENDSGKEKMAQEKIRNPRDFRSCDAEVATKRGEILGQGFDNEDREHHGVGVIDVQHEACDQRENQPLCE